jgi:hypothetical protein
MAKKNLRLDPKKWTLEEYEKIQTFRERALDSGEEYGNINAWENILEVCGMSKSEFWDMTPAEFRELINRITFEGVKKHPQKIKVKGVQFIAYDPGKKFRVTAPEAAAIERMAKAKGGIKFSEIMAALLMREGETREEKISTKNMNEKAAILKDMIAAEAMPFLASWAEACAEVLKIGLKDATE